MTQLASLTRFLEENLPERAQIPFTSDMDEISLLPCVRDLGRGQIFSRGTSTPTCKFRDYKRACSGLREAGNAAV